MQQQLLAVVWSLRGYNVWCHLELPFCFIQFILVLQNNSLNNWGEEFMMLCLFKLIGYVLATILNVFVGFTIDTCQKQYLELDGHDSYTV